MSFNGFMSMHLFTRLTTAFMTITATCLVAFNASAAEPRTRELYERVRPSVVEVVTQNRMNLGVSSTASGFITHRKDWVVTNYHAIADSIFEPEEHDIHVVTLNQGKLSVQVLAVDIHNDLAILQVEQTLQGPLLEIREVLPKRGEPGYSMGKPGNFQYSIVNGTFNGETDKATAPLLIFSGAINGGMSGGPTLDVQGRVVGVNVATSTQHQLVGLAVPAAALGQLIRSSSQLKPPDVAALRMDIAKQVFAANQKLVQQIDAPAHRVRRLGPFHVRGDLSTEHPCAAARKDKTGDFFKKVEQRCESFSGLFITDQQDAGGILSGTFWFHTDKMNAQGLARLVENQLSRLRDVREDEGPVGQWHCTEQRVRGRFDLPIQLHACRRAVEKLPGLFDFRFRYVPLVPGNDALVVAMNLTGFDNANARAVLQKSMDSLTFAPKAKP